MQGPHRGCLWSILVFRWYQSHIWINRQQCYYLGHCERYAYSIIMTPQSSAEFHKITVECGRVGEERKPHISKYALKVGSINFVLKVAQKNSFGFGHAWPLFSKKDANKTSELLRITLLTSFYGFYKIINNFFSLLYLILLLILFRAKTYDLEGSQTLCTGSLLGSP